MKGYYLCSNCANKWTLYCHNCIAGINYKTKTDYKAYVTTAGTNILKSCNKPCDKNGLDCVKCLGYYNKQKD